MIREQFAARYGHEPEVVVRAPGRVNLIGEHTDYALLPVMPLAIDRHVSVAVGSGADRLEAVSLRYPGETWTGDVAAVGWQRYVAAAVDRLEPGPGGTRLLVGGDLPADGGLSSSSALTVGVLAALHRWRGEDPPPDRLIDEAVASERALGVEGGTMDQTVIVAARAGTALRIDFAPPSRRFVALPDEMAVVVGGSGTVAEKAGSARDAYNAGVVGNRMAAAVVSHQWGLDAGDPPALGRVVDAAHSSVFPDSVSARQLAAETGIDPSRLAGLSAGQFDLDRPLPVAETARHMLDEAGRVDALEIALGSGDLVQAGRILDASHASLVRFGVGTAGLDRVTGAMRSAGAFGARLTGAGFGGFAVAICPVGKARDVVEAAEASTGGPAFRVHASDGVT